MKLKTHAKKPGNVRTGIYIQRFWGGKVKRRTIKSRLENAGPEVRVSLIALYHDSKKVRKVAFEEIMKIVKTDPKRRISELEELLNPAILEEDCIHSDTYHAALRAFFEICRTFYSRSVLDSFLYVSKRIPRRFISDFLDMVGQDRFHLFEIYYSIAQAKRNYETAQLLINSGRAKEHIEDIRALLSPKITDATTEMRREIVRRIERFIKIRVNGEGEEDTYCGSYKPEDFDVDINILRFVLENSEDPTKRQAVILTLGVQAEEQDPEWRDSGSQIDHPTLRARIARRELMRILKRWSMWGSIREEDFELATKVWLILEMLGCNTSLEWQVDIHRYTSNEYLPGITRLMP